MTRSRPPWLLGVRPVSIAITVSMPVTIAMVTIAVTIAVPSRQVGALAETRRSVVVARGRRTCCCCTISTGRLRRGLSRDGRVRAAARPVARGRALPGRGTTLRRRPGVVVAGAGAGGGGGGASGGGGAAGSGMGKLLRVCGRS
jgi:uncharacterized membrane protein YgcG